MRLLSLLLALLAAPIALAQPGALDPSFGDGAGYVTTDLGGDLEYAWALALQPDGKIVVGGHGRSMFLARYLPDGALDPSFGDGGVVEGDADDVYDLAIQPDGKILIVGGVHHAFYLARYLPDGSLDPSFGEDGVVLVDVSGQSIATSRSLVLQPDGKAVVTGYYGSGPRFAMIRVLPDGTLDSTFGDGGVVRTSALSDVEEVPVALTSDSKILVALNPPLGGWEFYLARFHADGRLDRSFGDDGRAFVCCWSEGKMEDVVVQPDGKILVGHKRYIFRYLPDGSEDPSFGDDGSAALVSTGATELALQPDGKIVAVGGCWFCDAFVARLLPDGAIDLAFGEGGVTITSMGNGGFTDVVLQPDGRIVASGGFSDLSVARYLNDLIVASEPEPSTVGLALSGPIPHPALSTARFTLSVPSAQPVRVAVYDALGREVTMLHDGPLAAGAHGFAFDGSRLPSGAYVVRVEGEETVAVRRLTLVR